MEVHPPEHTIHTWRDFLVHMGTIVLGLLIAISLEQTVEALHHRHQRQELRESLQSDNKKILRDNDDVEQEALANLTWLNARIAQVKNALHAHTPITEVPLKHIEIHSIPTDPAWKAAKASSLINVLPQDDIKAFSEVEALIDQLNGFHADHASHDARASFEQQFYPSADSPAPDFSSATHADLVEYLTLLNKERITTQNILDWTHFLRGAVNAVLRGERDLDRIDDEEAKVADAH